MSIFNAIILGIIQGVAEFLPVSSSGHLLITRNLMDLGEVPQLFDIFLHVGTLIVVIFVFRKKVSVLLRSLFRWIVRTSDLSDRDNLKMILLIIVATLFTTILGIVISELDFFQNPRVVSVFFIVTAILLWTTRYVKPPSESCIPSVKEGVIMGIAQGVGVIPGISRSGITISAALFVGIDREKAGEISFIISIPAIVGALLLGLKDGSELISAVSPIALFFGFITTMIVGYFSLIFLMKLIKSGRFYLFSFYLLPLGLFGFLFLS